MPSNSTRLPAHTLEADLRTFAAARRLHDYAPMNPQASLTTINQLDHSLAEARERTARAEGEYKAARRAELELERAVHNSALIVKDQVVAQYGSNSDAVEAVGLKRKTNRR